MHPASTYGDFTDLGSDQGCEGLTIVFSPSSISLKERWKNNSLSADFMADYVANFYSGETTEQVGRREEVKSALSFVANELIENAMKFSDADAGPISIRLVMQDGALAFSSTNGTSVANAEKYQETVKNLLGGDIWEEYARRASVVGESSGVGLLSMLTDYSAKIGWRFLAQDARRVTVTTTVRIPL